MKMVIDKIINYKHMLSYNLLNWSSITFTYHHHYLLFLQNNYIFFTLVNYEEKKSVKIGQGMPQN